MDPRDPSQPESMAHSCARASARQPVRQVPSRAGAGISAGLPAADGRGPRTGKGTHRRQSGCRCESFVRKASHCHNGGVDPHDAWVTLPGRIVGPSLTAAGLAAHVLLKNHREDAAAATRELQDTLDEALRSGDVDAVRVPRAILEHAVSLWETAAGLLESWSESVGGDAAADREGTRLRIRVASLRRALETE
jgi:hypothetical protein